MIVQWKWVNVPREANHTTSGPKPIRCWGQPIGVLMICVDAIDWTAIHATIAARPEALAIIAEKVKERASRGKGHSIIDTIGTLLSSFGCEA